MQLFVIPLPQIAEGDKYLIYRPLLGLAFIGNKPMVDIVQNYANDSILSNGSKENFEVKNFLSDIGFFNSEITPYKQSQVFTTAVLLLTNQCQLRCTYCYAAAGSSPKAALSLETGIVAIDYVYQKVFENQLQEFRLDFHGGGEPTIEWELLKNLTTYARNKSIKSKFSLTSNAIWSPDQVKWISDNIDHISISMDGAPITQDRNRPMANNRNSSPIVMRSLKLLDDLGKTYGIRMTIQKPWEIFSDNIEYIFNNTLCRSIQIEPAFNLERGEHSSPIQEEAKKFVDAFEKAYILSDRYQANLLFSGARIETLTNVFCRSPYEALVINPDNQVVACYEITNKNHPFSSIAVFGCIEEGKVIINHNSRNAFAELAQERLDSCKKCFCYWHCAGDCFTRSYSLDNNGHLEKNARCYINKSITLSLLLNKISTNDGVWSRFINKLYG